MLTIRAEPNLSSKKLGMVAMGQLVKIVKNSVGKRTMINGIYAYWAEVEYRGIRGFMYEGFLDRDKISITNEKWRGNYLLLMEGELGGLEYSPGLDWHGIYSRVDGEYLEQVEVNLEYKINQEMDDNIFVSTNKEERSRILIGTNENLEIGKVGLPMDFFTGATVFSDSYFLTPVFNDDGSVNANYAIHASDGFVLSTCYVENYTLSFCEKPSNEKPKCHQTFKDIVRRVGECNIPKIEWFGDLNGDNLPDFIFSRYVNLYLCYVVYFSKKNGVKVEFEKIGQYIPCTTSC